jgi:hypothetical protein
MHQTEVGRSRKNPVVILMKQRELLKVSKPSTCLHSVISNTAMLLLHFQLNTLVNLHQERDVAQSAFY